MKKPYLVKLWNDTVVLADSEEDAIEEAGETCITDVSSAAWEAEELENEEENLRFIKNYKTEDNIYPSTHEVKYFVHESNFEINGPFDTFAEAMKFVFEQGYFNDKHLKEIKKTYYTEKFNNDISGKIVYNFNEFPQGGFCIKRKIN
jgi:hypothetical protein